MNEKKNSFISDTKPEYIDKFPFSTTKRSKTEHNTRNNRSIKKFIKNEMKSFKESTKVLETYASICGKGCRGDVTAPK